MKRKAPTVDSVSRDLSELRDSLRHSPGVYDVMRLYAQYEKVLEQARTYLPGYVPKVTGFCSSDRTG